MIENPSKNSAYVVPGMKILVKFSNGDSRIFRITRSPNEISPAEGVISVESPLGRVLLGSHPESRLEYSVGKKSYQLEVVEVIP